MQAGEQGTILFLGASPEDRTRRALGRELRAITHRLRATPRGRALALAQEWAVRAEDLQACLLEHTPAVVHLGGQGSEAGQILLEDEQGRAAPVDPEALARLFGILRRGIRCVVMNACFSATQAHAIARHVDCVIGMGGTLENEASIVWSEAFYQALGYGESVGTAFALACNQIDLSSLPGGQVPQLIERVGVRADEVHLGRGPRGAAFVVPFLRNPSFVGRDDEIDRLHTLLGKNEAVGVRPAALTGMGGIGKTQLAVEYAYRYRDAYPGGVYWVNAARSWQDGFARLAEEVGLREDDAPEAERHERLTRAFGRFLKERSDALLVFDNVDDPRALQSDMLGLVPAALGCRLLSTTRRRDLRSSFASVEMRVLPPRPALELLLSSDARRDVLARKQEAEHAEAAGICRALGYLPLSLALAAAYLGHHPEIALCDYRGRLSREGALATVDDHELDRDDLATRHDAAVGATLRLQWDALKGEEQKRVLQTAALLGEAAHVPRARLALLTGLRDRAERGYPARLGSALRKLGELSLVEELTEQEIRLHPLVREFAEMQIVGRDAFAAACAERLGEALWDLGRLHEEVGARGIDEVLVDLRLGAALAGAGGCNRFESLIRPLDREAHQLRGWDPTKEPGFLLQQLRNQCFEMALPQVQGRAEAKLAEQQRAYLRERFRTSGASEALARTLEGHTGWVNVVAVSPDGRLVLSASQDHTLKLWDLSTGHELKTLQGHTSAVTSVAITPDGRLAVSASPGESGGTLKVWDLSTVHELKALVAETEYPRAFSHTRTLTDHEHEVLQRYTSGVSGVTVSPDGRYVIFVTRSHDTLKVWDLSTGRNLKSLRGHSRPVTSVAITPDGRHAVSASMDRTLKVWDLSISHELGKRRVHTGRVNGVAVSTDGRLALSAFSDGTLKILDLQTGHEVKTLRGHTDRVNGVAVTPDGRYAVSGASDGALKVWDLSTGHELTTLLDHTDWVNGVAISPDGRFAISASDDHTLNVWDLSTGHELTTLHGHTSAVSGVAVSPDGHIAVSASSDGTLRVWELSTSHELRTLQGHTNGVSAVAVSPDGRLILSASIDRTLKVWDLSAGQELKTLRGHTDTVRGVAVSPDSRHAISASSDGTFKVWDLSTGEAVATLKLHAPLYCCAVTPDGRTFLAGDEAGAVHILDWILPEPLAHR